MTVTYITTYHQRAGVHFTVRKDGNSQYFVWVDLDGAQEPVAVIMPREGANEHRWVWRLLDWPSRYDTSGYQTISDAAEWAVWAWAVRRFVWPGRDEFDVLPAALGAA